MKFRRWSPAIVAVVAFAAVAGWSALARGSSTDGSVVAGPPSGGSASAAAVTSSTVTRSTTPAATTTTAPAKPLLRELARGVSGDDVKMVQQRLYSLGFDPGGVDGVYGTSTIEAVWAYEKLVMGTPPGQVTGRVTPAFWQRMEQPLNVVPRRPAASVTHVEVYLPQQVLVVFRNNKPILISHISTGSNEHWCEVVKVDNDDGTETEKGVCGESKTPGGVYYFYRRKTGWWESELGRMWNPVYFNYGLAVHGAGNVPNYPASHGCVRVPLHIGNYFPSLVKYGDQIFVFDGVKEPEAYGKQPPPFNTPDPNFTTTTSSTTTTTAVTRPSTQTSKPPTSKPVTHPPTTPPSTAPSPSTTVTAATVGRAPTSTVP
jgi:peptidoglycan hydrolase-like protein with peptidoglycan-binding domain